jgi:hypothetical protein
MANLDDKAKGHVGSLTFQGYIVPENVIGKDKDNTEAGSRRGISLYYLNRMVKIGSM